MTTTPLDIVINYVKQKSAAVSQTNKLEVEIRFDIDSRNKSYSTSTINPVELAEYILKTEEGNYAVESTINFIEKNNKIASLVFEDNKRIKEKTSYYKKEKLCNTLYVKDEIDYSINVNSENKIDEKEFKYPDDTIVRLKLRYSFVKGNWRWDITLVKKSNMKDVEKDKNGLFQKTNQKLEKIPWGLSTGVEFEAEYVGDYNQFNSDEIVTVVEQMKNWVSDVYDDDHAKKLNILSKLLGRQKAKSLKQLCNQVIDMNYITYHSTVKTNPENYMITDKIEGIRTLLCITGPNTESEIGESFYINNEVHSINLESDSLCIFDCEYVDGKFYVFDILVNDDYVITELSFEDRYEILTKIFSEKKWKNVKLKEFVHLTDDYKDELKEFEDRKRQYETDGLIFNPINDTYFNMEVMKYKPLNKLSIDLLVKKCPEEITGIHPFEKINRNVYLLFCGISKQMFNCFGMKLVKHYSNLFGTPQQYFPVQFESSIYKYTYVFHSDEDDLDGKIVEFAYDGFVPKMIRIREDRDADVNKGGYYGNDFRVAESTLMNIVNHYSLYEDRKSYFTKDDENYKSIRNYNRYVISESFKMLKNSTSVLDLAAGKGQDLIRYMTHGVQNLLCIDKDLDALTELISRKYSMINIHKKNNRLSTNVKILNADLNDKSENIVQIIKSNLSIVPQSMNVVVCNFAIHYMLDSKGSATNFLKTVNSFLEKGGRFIFTCFDGYKIKNLIQVSDWASKDEDGNVKYSIKMKTPFDTESKFGQKISVLLPVSDEPYLENLVFIDLISDILFQYKMDLELNKSFLEYYGRYNSSLSEKDKEFISLYHLYVFKKRK